MILISLTQTQYWHNFQNAPRECFQFCLLFTGTNRIILNVCQTSTSAAAAKKNIINGAIIRLVFNFELCKKCCSAFIHFCCLLFTLTNNSRNLELVASNAREFTIIHHNHKSYGWKKLFRCFRFLPGSLVAYLSHMAERWLSSQSKSDSIKLLLRTIETGKPYRCFVWMCARATYLNTQKAA